MKNFLLIGILLMLMISCKKEINKADLVKINGYWEIQEAKNSTDKKDYKVNQTIDYFNVENNAGFRQKVMPQLDGTFLTNNLKEEVLISNKEGSFTIKYATKFGKWEEEIVAINDSVLVLKNKEFIYYYKRFTPFIN